MNDPELIAALHQARRDIADLLVLLKVPDIRDNLTVLDRMKESYNGWPRSSGFDGNGGRSATDSEGELLPGHADPTGDAASRIDHAHLDHQSLAKDTAHLRRTLDHLLVTAGKYRLRTANVIEQDSTKNPDLGCSSCHRIPGPRTTHWWNPIFRGTLCRWCLDHQRITGRLPTTQELADYRDGRRVRRTA